MQHFVEGNRIYNLSLMTLSLSFTPSHLQIYTVIYIKYIVLRYISSSEIAFEENYFFVNLIVYTNAKFLCPIVCIFSTSSEDVMFTLFISRNVDFSSNK